MDTLKGNLIITARFSIPVHEGQYRAVKNRKGVVTVADIVAAEEENYMSNIDGYFDMISDYVEEVDITFEEGRRNERRDDVERG